MLYLRYSEISAARLRTQLGHIDKETRASHSSLIDLIRVLSFPNITQRPHAFKSADFKSRVPRLVVYPQMILK